MKLTAKHCNCNTYLMTVVIEKIRNNIKIDKGRLYQIVDRHKVLV